MRTLTIRDFRSRPKAVRQALSKEGEAILTVNGKPVAVLIAVGGGIEETLDLVERVRAQRAVRALRAAARRSGIDRLAARRVDSLIRTVRRQRNRTPTV